MKYIILLTVSAAAVAVGKMCSQRYKRRVTVLEDFMSLVNTVESRVEFSVPVTDIINEYISAHGDALTFLQEAMRLNDGGQDFRSAWQNALEKHKRDIPADDCKLLCDFGSLLGTTGCDGQVELCRLYKQLISENLRTAKNEYMSKGKLFSRLGVFCALFIAVIFI